VLDVSSCRADRTDLFVDVIRLAVGEAARRIEAEIFRATFGTSRIVLLPTADGPGSGLLAVAADDLVIGATRSARLVPAADLLGGPDAIEHLGDVQRSVLQRALLRAEGNVSAAAKALGVSRATPSQAEAVRPQAALRGSGSFLPFSAPRLVRNMCRVSQL
jgi:transcriptional regulator of acetoin/glycerol metabolism